MLLLSRGDAPFIVLGLPLYVGYYTVHDDRAGNLGFAPHKTSSKPKITWGILPTKELGDADDQKKFDQYIEKARDEKKVNQADDYEKGDIIGDDGTDASSKI